MIGWLVGHSGNEVASSDVDVGFLQDMRVHHEQAVLMSDIFLSRPDIDDQLVPVAQSIQFGQSIEIGIMLQLLRDMGAPTESDDGQAMAWMGMPHRRRAHARDRHRRAARRARARRRVRRRTTCSSS